MVSAQFRAQLDVFGAALQSGQLDLAQFGLQAEVRLCQSLASTIVTVVFRTCFMHASCAKLCGAAAGLAACFP